MIPGRVRHSANVLRGSAAARRAGLIAGIALTVLLASCSESLESSAGCPILCPSQNLEIKEVVLEAIEFDATVAGFPNLGQAPFFTIAASGDSLDSRVIVRFDSLPNVWRLGGVDSNVSAVDSAHFRLFVDTAASKLKSAVTIEVYDVDTTAADANTSAILALFRPDRLIGSTTLSAPLSDTLNVSISNAVLLSKILGNRRLRVGVRMRSDSTSRLVVNTANQGLFPRLRYDPAPNDPTVNVFERVPRSFTPVEDLRLAVDFTDYLVVASGPFPLRKNAVGLDTAGVFRDTVLAVGGISGRRVYLRFALPDSVLSASIIRATLILNKKPSSNFGNATDTIAVVPQAIFARDNVPVAKAVALTDTTRLFPMASQRLAPATAGEVRFDIVSYARTWSTDTTARIPFALSLRAGLEDKVIQEILFYSTSAPALLRPRLRITYVPRQAIGLP